MLLLLVAAGFGWVKRQSLHPTTVTAPPLAMFRAGGHSNFKLTNLKLTPPPVWSVALWPECRESEYKVTSQPGKIESERARETVTRTY